VNLICFDSQAANVILSFSRSIQLVRLSSGFGKSSGFINLGKPESSPAMKSSFVE